LVLVQKRANGPRAAAFFLKNRPRGADGKKGECLFLPDKIKIKAEIPVIFFQAGDGRHLPFTFCQARHWGGGSPLILLGDASNRHYRGLEHVPIRDFAREAIRFRECYVHLSSNSWEFEFFSLARWLVIEEFARGQGIGEFLYLDSDVLLYENPSTIAARFPGGRMTLSWPGGVEALGSTPVGAGQSLIRDPSILREFAERLFHFYTDPAEIRQGKEEVAEDLKRSHGGISDMWHWTHFAKKHAAEVINSWQPAKEGVLDMNIAQKAGFRMSGGVKEIRFKNGLPHGFYETEGAWRRFATLHFGGGCKKIMAKYLGRSFDLSLACAYLQERINKGLPLSKGNHELFGEADRKT